VQLRDSRLLLSATDLVNFHECEYLTALDRARAVLIAHVSRLAAA
jgi:hypothetical protein